MPLYAFLQYDSLPCPSCGAPMPGDTGGGPAYIAFMWGYCPSRYPGEVVYRVGDEITWRACQDGIIRGWTSFDGGWQFNVGDPAIRTLIVCDYGSDVSNFPTHCGKCGGKIGSGAIHIENNIIVSAWAFSPGKLLEAAPKTVPGVWDHGDHLQIDVLDPDPFWPADHFIPGENHSWNPIRDWSDRVDYIDSPE